MSGFGLIATSVILSALGTYELSGILLWLIGFLGAILMGVGNVGRWANVTHPI